MKRMLLALTLAVLLSVAVVDGVASASHDPDDFQSAVDEMRAVDPTLNPPPNDPTKDFAVGGFQAAAEARFGLSAHTNGPKAEGAWGHVSDTQLQFDRKGLWRVVCLAVLGSKASIGLEPQNTAANDIGPVVFLVRDSGLPGGTGDMYSFVGGIRPENCERGLVFEPPFQIERGNILVHDAQP